MKIRTVGIVIANRKNCQPIKLYHYVWEFIYLSLGRETVGEVLWEGLPGYFAERRMATELLLTLKFSN